MPSSNQGKEELDRGASRSRKALTMLIVAVVWPASQAWAQTASAPPYELFLTDD